MLSGVDASVPVDLELFPPVLSWNPKRAILFAVLADVTCRWADTDGIADG
jgi:hypothetical protein